MMIETIAVPVLLKAVDWLFGEGSKILQERRERPKAQNENIKEDSKTNISFIPSTSTGVKSKNLINSKEVAMTQMIDEKGWLNEEAEVKHLLSLLEIYSQNYRLAKEQYSMWGKGLVPPIIVHNLTEAEDGIAITTKKLQIVLSKVYGKDVVAPEVDAA